RIPVGGSGASCVTSESRAKTSGPRNSRVISSRTFTTPGTATFSPFQARRMLQNVITLSPLVVHYEPRTERNGADRADCPPDPLQSISLVFNRFRATERQRGKSVIFKLRKPERDLG